MFGSREHESVENHVITCSGCVLLVVLRDSSPTEYASLQAVRVASRDRQLAMTRNGEAAPRDRVVEDGRAGTER